MIGKKGTGLIRSPGRRLLRFLPLRFANKQNHGGRRLGYADLNLTSMVDMLTILVVFLLQTFSSTGELFRVSDKIQLPESSRYQELVEAPLVSISEAGVEVNGNNFATKAELTLTNYNDYKIKGLYNLLVQERKKFPDPSKFKGYIFFQVDKNLDFKFVKRVLYTCTQAGYTTVKPLVLQPSGSS